QFTHALTWAPDPAKAIEAFDQFLDLILKDERGSKRQKGLDFVKDKRSFPLLARLLGASDFLWEDFLRRQHSNLLPMLETYRVEPLIKSKQELDKILRRRLATCRTDEQRRQALNQFKDEELFRIDMKHLLDSSTSLADFSLALTQLAETIVSRSVTAGRGSPTADSVPSRCWGWANSAAANWATPPTSKCSSSMEAPAGPTADNRWTTASTSNGWSRNSYVGSKPSRRGFSTWMCACGRTGARDR